MDTGNCVFCKISTGEIPKDFTYQDDEIMVFPDIHPIKPVHLLIVPKQHVKEFVLLEEGPIKEKMFNVVQKMIKMHGLEENGYRITINGGGLQEVDHLHIHLTGPHNSAT